MSINRKVRNEKGFILHKRRVRENDLLVSFLLAEGDLLITYAPSALRSRQRFPPGVLEPPHYVNISFEERKKATGDVSCVLKEAQLIYSFHGIRSDYSRIELMFYFLKSVKNFAREGDANSGALFQLLGRSLKALEAAENLENLRLWFEIRLMVSQGLFSERDFLNRGVEFSREGILKAPPLVIEQIQKEIHQVFSEFLGRASS